MKDSKKNQSKTQKKAAGTASRKDKPDKKQAHKKSPNIPNMLGQLQDQIDQTTSEDVKGRAPAGSYSRYQGLSGGFCKRGKTAEPPGSDYGLFASSRRSNLM